MAVTFRQLMNRALRITGETEIADAVLVLSDKEHLLIAEVTNELREEVEAAHNWRALRSTETIAFTSGETSNTIPAADERSRIVRIQDPLRGCEVPLAFDITDSTAPFPLKELDLADLLYRRTMDTSSGNKPWAFAMDNTEGNVMKVQLFPTPTDTRSIQLTLVIPQARMDGTDQADLARTIKTPVKPMVMALVRWILEDRGEELGINSRYSEEKEREALQDAVSLDAAEQGDYNLVPE